MNHAVIAWGRFNPPTEEGHGKLVKAVQDHAEKVGGTHYIFPTHTQDKKKNPLTHEQKVGAMRELFPNANVVSHSKVKTIIDAMKHLESKGHKEVTVVAGSDRVDQYHKMLNQYRSKEYPKIKKVNVVSAGHRDPDAEGAEGMSASKLRGLVAAGKKKEFISHYSDKKLGKNIHDMVHKAMNENTNSPIGIFLLGGPGSGKDYVLKNIFSRFDLTEVQADQIVSGAASALIESKTNIVINGANDADNIELIKTILEGYDFDHVYVSVSNKVSRLRNGLRDNPLPENKRLEKWYKLEKLVETIDHTFVFNNSINLNESSEFEKVFFAAQIEKLLKRLVEQNLVMKETAEPKTFVSLREKVYMPAKYKTGNPKTDKARAAHWKKMSKFSDRDPRAYKDAPGDKKAREEGIPLSRHTVAVRKMMAKEETVIDEGAADKSLAAKAEKSGVSLRTLKAVYRRGVAAWNSGHRPGTTPSQWGHARVNSYINKGKTYHTADKDLREETKIVGTNCMNCIHWVKESEKPVDKSELNENGGLKAPNEAYVKMSKHVDLVTLPGKATVKIKAYCDHEEINDFVTERMCCAYWDGKGVKREFKGTADVMEENDLNGLFEMQLLGTDEYRKHAIDMTPGQKQEIDDAFKNMGIDAGVARNAVKKEDCGCGGNCKCAETESGVRSESSVRKSFNQIRSIYKEETKEVDLTPTLKKGKVKGLKAPSKDFRSTMDGLPVASRLGGAYNEEKKSEKGFMPTPRQVPAPPGGHPVPPGYKRVKDHIAGWKLVKEEEAPELTLEEAVKYHVDNKISFTENVFRPGSTMFFDMIAEAKKLYMEGNYTPADEYEQDLLNSDIGEKAMFEGKEVILDFPYEELNEADDPTGGKGIGKPFRSGGGGAVYVKNAKGNIIKVNFSQSGMKKRYNEPGRVRSFVARHKCLTNKDRTSASYWACRWPRYFSNTGQLWW